MKNWKKEHNSIPEDNHERLFDENGNYLHDDENIIDIQYTYYIIHQHNL